MFWQWWWIVAILALAFIVFNPTKGFIDPITYLYRWYTAANQQKHDEEAAASYLSRQASRQFILDVLSHSSHKNLNMDLPPADLGALAVKQYGTGQPPTFAGGGGGTGTPNPGDPELTLELPCKLKLNASAVVGQIKLTLQSIDVCQAALYSCIGTALLKCPADQDMKCVKWALDQKCVFF